MSLTRRTRRGRIAFAAAGTALLIALGALAPPAAEASSLQVTVKGTLARRRNVAVTIAGQDLGAGATRKTGSLGTVKFAGIPGDSYLVTPDRFGYRFSPPARLVRVPDAATLGTSFAVEPLPAVGAVSASRGDLVLRKTLTATVVVTATDKAGNGILGAPVKAASSDTFYVTVEPGVALTDALGRATFTLGAGAVLGDATVTFSSGGWRGTAVRTAVTAVTVKEGLEAELWVSSGHADYDSMAFRDWDDAGAVPATCSRCHSKTGYLNLVTGQPAVSVPVGEVIDCFLCHDPAVWSLTEVKFPSGAAVSGLGQEAICMTCHQGRSSAPTVDAKVAGLPEDEVSASLTFSNIHYFAAAATQYGTVAKGGYEYAGRDYDRRAPHVSSKNVCQECHNPHSLALKLEECWTCHPGATDYAGVRRIRMAASTADYDGDGNTTEGIADEVDGVAALLYGSIRAYGRLQGFPIAYDSHAYPYFFNDPNDNGVADAGETSYRSWTPRLLKAAYNYQVYQKDPGRHGHNAKYVIQLLFDSVESLDARLATPVAPRLARNDGAHFDTAKKALRYWDGGTVGSSCARCHGGEDGFRAFVEGGYPASIPGVAPVSRFSCETCHTGTDFAGAAPRRYVDRIVFPTYAGDPSPLTAFNDPSNPDDSFLCATCHMGRQSKRGIDSYIAGRAAFTAEDAEDPGASFRNVHYLPAGGIQHGKLAGVGYEYPGKTYAVKFTHWGGTSQGCAYCHDVKGSGHTFEARLAPVCANCHTEIRGGDIETIRFDRPSDYDGDGNAAEMLKDEIATLREALMERIQAYANTGQATPHPIVYDGETNPYFFNDADGSGDYSAGDTGYSHWTPRLLKAAHNYQVSMKEPGAWAHNTEYVVQLLIDSIDDLGGDVSGYHRPFGF